MEKCSDKMESSFNLFSALKMKNINKGNNRHTNKIMVTVGIVATPVVVIDKNITTIFFDQPSLAI